MLLSDMKRIDRNMTSVVRSSTDHLVEQYQDTLKKVRAGKVQYWEEEAASERSEADHLTAKNEAPGNKFRGPRLESVNY